MSATGRGGRGRSDRARARRDRAREAIRQEILADAAAVLARRGSAEATLAEVAQASGFAAPSLYRYFRSKDELLRGLHAAARAHLDAIFEAPVDSSRPLADRLADLLAGQMRTAALHGDVMAILLAPRQRSARGRRLPAAKFRFGVPLFEHLMEGWLRRHVVPGELRCPLESATRPLAAIFCALLQSPGTGPRREPGPSPTLRQIVDLVLHGIASERAA